MKKTKTLVLLAFIYAFFAGQTAHAQIEYKHIGSNKKGKSVTRLTATAISDFIEEMQNAAAGSSGLDPEQTLEYFQLHLADDGIFRSRTTYNLPGFPARDSQMAYDKDGFIANIANGQGLMQDYSTSVTILDIQMNGPHAATIQTNIKETGKMPWPDGNGGETRLPIEGFSDCEQKLAISNEGYIQLAGANCTTVINFSAFSKPLGE